MNTEFDIDVELKELEQKEQHHEELKKQHEEVVRKQSTHFFSTVGNVLPLLKYLKGKGYRFTNDTDNNYASIRGPVLEYDREKRKLYVFDIEEQRILEIDMNSDDQRSSYYNPHIYFEIFSFEKAMEGLKQALSAQDRNNKAYENDIAKRELEIQKYSSLAP